MQSFKLDLPAQWWHCHLDQTDSTLLRLHESPYNERTEPFVLLTAGFQTAGRGQRGSSWEAEPDKNLLFSFRFHPRSIKATQQFALSEALALAVADALGEYTEGICVKWPNDVYWHDRKICGMLLEHDLQGERIETTFTGVGINVNQKEFRSDAPNPVSLRQILGRDTDRGTILENVLQRFIENCGTLLCGKADALHERYCHRLYRRDGFHKYRDTQGEFLAEIADISPQGMLTLRREDGTTHTYAFKEVAFVL